MNGNKKNKSSREIEEYEDEDEDEDKKGSSAGFGGESLKDSLKMEREWERVWLRGRAPKESCSALLRLASLEVCSSNSASVSTVSCSVRCKCQWPLASFRRESGHSIKCRHPESSFVPFRRVSNAYSAHIVGPQPINARITNQTPSGCSRSTSAYCVLFIHSTVYGQDRARSVDHIFRPHQIPSSYRQSLV